MMFRAELIGKWYYFDNSFFLSENNIQEEDSYNNSIYEVIRVINFVPVFIEDHFARFRNSIRSLGVSNTMDIDTLKRIVEQLAIKNNIQEGNIRFELFSGGKQTVFAAYQIPHFYPSDKQYTEGVKLKTWQIERPDPHIKQSAVNNKVRTEITRIFEQDKVYEVLLVNHLNQVTEGSKSNIFFVSDIEIYTPPSELMLEGITRKRLLSLIKQTNYKLVEIPITVSDLKNFKGCFLTGTSPKVLPVNQIDTFYYNPLNPIIQGLITLFNNHLADYCSNYKNQ